MNNKKTCQFLISDRFNQEINNKSVRVTITIYVVHIGLFLFKRPPGNEDITCHDWHQDGSPRHGFERKLAG